MHTLNDSDKKLLASAFIGGFSAAIKVLRATDVEVFIHAADYLESKAAEENVGKTL